MKFVRHDARDAVYFRRDTLREDPQMKNVFIDENLTEKRRWLYNQVRKEKQWESRTYDGTIYVKQKGTDDREFRITTDYDYFKVFGKSVSY